jgi:hypothetical protein
VVHTHDSQHLVVVTPHARDGRLVVSRLLRQARLVVRTEALEMRTQRGGVGVVAALHRQHWFMNGSKTDNLWT